VVFYNIGVMSIDLPVCFYGFQIRFYNYSDGVVCFIFHFIPDVCADYPGINCDSDLVCTVADIAKLCKKTCHLCKGKKISENVKPSLM